MQISFHTEHFSTARKIISDVLLLLLVLERFGICLLRLCVGRDVVTQAFTLKTWASNQVPQRSLVEELVVKHPPVEGSIE
jgi:hypothetical protein